LVELDAGLVEARALGRQVVRPDDGRVAARGPGADVALLDHGHVLHPVVLGQVVGRGHAVGAAADDDGVVARPQRVRAEEPVLAQEPDHAVCSCSCCCSLGASAATTLVRAMPIISPASRIASQKYSPYSQATSITRSSPRFRTSAGTRITEPAMQRPAAKRDSRTSRPDERLKTSRRRSPPRATPAYALETSSAGPPIRSRSAPTRENGHST